MALWWKRKKEVSSSPFEEKEHSLATLSVSQQTLEECQQKQAAPFFHPQILTEREKNPFLSWETMNIPIRIFQLNNIYLESTYMVPFQDGRPLSECTHVDLLLVDGVLQQAVAAEYSGAAIICCDHWHNNYYHWFSHTVPLLFYIKTTYRKENSPTLILPAPLLAWQKETLYLLGIEDYPCLGLERGKLWRFDHFLFCDFSAGRADFALSYLTQAAYDYLLRQCWHSDHFSALTHIYLSRIGHVNRAIPNEEKVISAVETCGFTAIQPEKLKVRDQVNLFAHAHVVMGQIGAGLANISFLQPGSTLYELLPKHHENPCFLNRAMQAHLYYWGDSFDSNVTGEDHISQWSTGVDIELIKSRARTIAHLLR